jgi:phosphatidylserine decarboxylase
MEITLFNRESKKLEEETVFGKSFMGFMYGTKSGKLLTNLVLIKPFFSKFYGNLLKRPSSKKKIEAFIKQHNIDVSEIIAPISSFNSFNEFFIRKLKPEARPVELKPDIFISPADSRLFAYELNNETVIPVKGKKITLSELICDTQLTEKYKNGLCLVFRLAPADYHRFCFVDEGSQSTIKPIGNFFHSVNPIALDSGLPVFQGNYREYCELKTKNFGEILDIDVGALGVSKIIQHFPNGTNFKKGDEKGYFEFGGSTTILILKQGIIKLDEDIMEYSKKGIETLVKYGSPIGKKIV